MALYRDIAEAVLDRVSTGALAPGATLPSVDELRAHVGGALIRAKQPRVVVQVDALPRTDATGQVRRRRLRDQIVADRASS